MLFPESRRSPRYDISAYSNEFGKFSAMLLPIIVNSFDPTGFPEKSRLFSYIGDICVKSIILSDNAIKLIEGDALLNMKYKTCLENLDLSYNKFDYHGWLVITFFVLFNNLKSINFSGKLYCNDLKPRKKAPCFSEPINPIPSDAFFITKRSTFLNVLKKLLSIDEHLNSEKFST
jgi:hypothetical protein